MIRVFLATALLTITLPTSALPKGRCASGKAASDYKAFQYMVNNAVRTADEYAMKRNPRATFIMAKAEAVYQIAGKHAGGYLVKLLSETPNGTSFAMLKPSFDFCADPSSLDDSREDLFEVVVAKFNGRSF